MSVTITDNWNQELKTVIATAFQNLLDHDIETDRSHMDLVRDELADDEAQVAEQHSKLL